MVSSNQEYLPSQRSRRSPHWTPFLVMLLLAGCSGGTGGEGAWQADRSVRDGADVIRTLSGSVWEGEARLEEELALTPRGDDERYILGEVMSVLQHDGRIYVLDLQARTVRVFDAASGEHLMDIGREGQGPGEFVYPSSLAVHPANGDLMVRDGQAGRINLFDPATGAYRDAWPIPPGFTISDPMVLTSDGRLWTQRIVSHGEGILDWKEGMVTVGPEGVGGDTLSVPDYDYEQPSVVATRPQSTSVRRVPFTARIHWAMSPMGPMVSGVATDYTFRIDRPDAGTLIIEKAWEPVRVQPGEGEWYQKQITLRLHRMYPGWEWDGPAPPSHKPAYEELVPDHAGRVWVRRPGPGIPLEGCDPDPQTAEELQRNPCWEQTVTWEVFDLEGHFLGGVELPDGVVIDRRSFIEGDVVLTLHEAEDGTPSVRRYRLVLP